MTTSRLAARVGAFTKHGVAVSYGLLVVLIVAAVIYNPAFASWGNIQAQLQIATFIGVIAIGQTLVILTGQIDLSVPWNLTFSSILMATLYGQGYGAVTAVGAALLVGIVVGLINAVGVAVFRLHSLVWTLGMNALLEGLTMVYTNGQPPDSTIPGFVRFLAVGHVGGFPVAPIVWAVFAAITIVVLARSRFGRFLYATGNNEPALFLSGIDSRIVYVGAFVASSVCAVLAGILLTGYASQTYLGMGNDYLLVPIAAVIIGGTNIMGGFGGYVGTIAGTLIVVLLQSILSVAQIGQAGKNIVFGVIIIALVLLYAREARPTD
ncbi:ABC transporter permease [Jiella sp. MQZ9-1]|uniref:ABC transporter permease n=1 Tax=Jiella flava TaxID=2816857 RepID=A0A939FY20_9HYPH|nr:ABC transporter permease [Jiella flava]MBO0662979.1 ABC transporter permease [Jiella flava]MCD2471261.1 ABC transporter permease [Jiella flava]